MLQSVNKRRGEDEQKVTFRGKKTKVRLVSPESFVKMEALAAPLSRCVKKCSYVLNVSAENKEHHILAQYL